MSKLARKRFRLRQDITIPAGTIIEEMHVRKTEYGPGWIEEVLGFGPNASGHLRVGTEPGDPGFDEWFEEVE